MRGKKIWSLYIIILIFLARPLWNKNRNKNRSWRRPFISFVDLGNAPQFSQGSSNHERAKYRVNRKLYVLAVSKRINYRSALWPFHHFSASVSTARLTMRTTMFLNRHFLRWKKEKDDVRRSVSVSSYCCGQVKKSQMKAARGIRSANIRNSFEILYRSGVFSSIYIRVHMRRWREDC